ncbi:MAG: alpha-2-macroglobulin family protein [Kiritimatiellia bacterium]
MKKITIGVGWLILMGCLLLAGLAGTARAVWLELRLGRRAPESAESRRGAAQAPAPAVAGDASGGAPKAAQEAKKPVPDEAARPANLRVETAMYDKTQDKVRLEFNARPDMDVLRNYVSVGPLRSGVANFSFDIQYDYDWERRSRRCRYWVDVEGDFAYRTNVVLRLREGLPAAGEFRLGALEAEKVLVFRRRDAPPRVQFATRGRYLPPCGERLLAVDSINVAKIRLGAAAIPPANIVQLLAREEGVYKKIWQDMSADSECTEDLAGKLREWEVKTTCVTNEHCITPCRLRTLPEASSNGVFLVMARSGDSERKEWFLDEEWNPNRYRLVCVTDMGLTVRQNGSQLLVWTTSLATGRPVTNGVIDVYASNNRRIGTGAIDGRGLCAIACEKDETPFAVIARAADGTDTSFLCLKDRLSLEERQLPDGVREPYLAANELTAFVWTERKIYRHGEPIFMHAILRNGTFAAPRPLPVEARLVDPSGKVVGNKSLVSDAEGAVWFDGFAVAAERPSGMWRVEVCTPGKDGKVLGQQKVSVEEFVPPQIRVTVVPKVDCPTNITFDVTAEHLFGGPAKNLACHGIVLFEDVPFSPVGWTNWSFGDETKGLNPSCRRLEETRLDGNGHAAFQAPLLAESGSPKAAVRVTGQGIVTTAGGRSACAQATDVLHCHPFYVGTDLAANVRIRQTGHPVVRVACVKPDGTRLPESRRLKVEFERVESVYSCREKDRNWVGWECERVFIPCPVATKEIETKADADVELAIPFRRMGDYRLRLTDERAGVTFAKTFWLGDCGDNEIRAPLANPANVTLSTDKAIYRPGERPRLLVKAPFAGWALLTLMREKVLSTKVFRLSGATAELVLDPVDGDWTPNVDVALNVVQTAENGGYGQTARAHGRTSIAIRRPENELPVTVATSYAYAGSGPGILKVDVSACGPAATGTTAVVTLVDEGIHSLTKWTTPAPVEHFARLRSGRLPLFDLFDNLLPVWDGDPAKICGVKTGGGGELEMLGRMSPIRSRRFRSLALWQTAVPLTDGRGSATFALPEFSGAVRVTAVAYAARAVGAGDARQKIAPKLVMEPDLPRFAAPADRFAATLSLFNRSGSAGDVAWTVEQRIEGRPPAVVATGRAALAEAASTNLSVDVAVPDRTGTLNLVFAAEGFGERHAQTIELPIRPAVAARETSRTIMLAPGETKTFTVAAGGSSPESTVRTFTMYGNRLGELVGALEFLANYPHGCLEQTASQIFPLVAAGGFLNQLQVTAEPLSNRTAYVEAGLRRVQSMIRANDFTMWPDTDYPPWDREVSLYAAHFLLAAEKNGHALNPVCRRRVGEFLRKWVFEKEPAVKAYACQILALAGTPMTDQMLTLYDGRAKLAVLSRVRLARAFALAGDRVRARELVAHGVARPDSVVEAAFTILALLELNPQDERLGVLVAYLEEKRVPSRYDWGTTRENAHALLALGAYYRHHPPAGGKPQLALVRAGGTERILVEKKPEIVRGAEPVRVENRGAGTAWLAWREIGIPAVASVTNESRTIAVTRTIRNAQGKPIGRDAVRRGDWLTVDLELKSETPQTFSDLVVVDLFPAAFEPDCGEMRPAATGNPDAKRIDWVMRADARDDRMLVFSKRFKLERGQSVRFRYLLHAVTPGRFTLPGPSVEAMYAPDVYSTCAPDQLQVLP